MLKKTRFARRISNCIVLLSTSLIQRALLSDLLRPSVMNEIEKYLVEKVKLLAAPGIPARVTEDKADMTRALVRSIHRALERGQLSPKPMERLLTTLLENTVLGLGQAREAWREFTKRHEGQKPPVTMVISPTRACNLECIGCYASADSRGIGLDWDTLDRILTEAKTLWGLRFFTLSGGEPLAYRSRGHDILDLAERHDDCFFLLYTNGTLIDRSVAQRMAELGNLTPAISVEGFEARTDERRGDGVFQRILDAMAHLRAAGVLFGVSLTATRHNAEEILSDAFIDFFFEEQQAVYGWLFQYMPIGRSFTLERLVTPQQRVWMWRRTWEIVRERHIMLADFWNCGTTSEGCIAAARDNGYLYIDWNGKVMPCVFLPFSPANIHDIHRRGGTLDDVYDLPYFNAIRQWQLDYAAGRKRPEGRGNWLVPCSIRDHYAHGREIIERHQPDPEDEAARVTLEDPHYAEGLSAYDEELYRCFDPIWKQEYLKAPETALTGTEGGTCRGRSLH